MPGRILVVDDDIAMCDIIKDTLEEYGYSVDTVFSITEAEDYLSGGKTELIILDINLPDGTGYDFCKDSAPVFSDFCKKQKKCRF